jgi:hypothetical protein
MTVWTSTSADRCRTTSPSRGVIVSWSRVADMPRRQVHPGWQLRRNPFHLQLQRQPRPSTCSPPTGAGLPVRRLLRAQVVGHLAGRTPTVAQLDLVEQALLPGAKAHGFDTELWTLGRIVDTI